MKELSIEEKAKAYDEALKIAKSKIRNDKDHVLYEDDIIEMFSELAESEDERIKKEIIDYIKTGTYHKDWIAWLEKQGEQNPTLPKWKYKKDNTPLLRDSLILNKYGCVAKSPSGALVSDVWVLDFGELAKLPKEEFEKQGEKKPADKVEPKFKVGDKIISTISNISYYITDVCNGHYLTDAGCIIMFNAQDNFELVEQKPAWSEDDEEILNNIIAVVYTSDRSAEEIHWLKSLKERHTWKPSEEQMQALEHFVRSVGESGYTSPYDNNTKLLYSLLSDLKKLK